MYAKLAELEQKGFFLAGAITYFDIVQFQMSSFRNVRECGSFKYQATMIVEVFD